MSIGRYNFVKKIRKGKYYGTSYASTIIFSGVERGLIDFVTIELKEKQRLDHLAGAVYNDSSYWWVIAAASGIGWGLQVPPGTVIRIPSSLEDVMSVL
tara:strand:- start:577 stop:870 length:294 start_codon:yes stop_codon:yes gene_type:complete